ncbi:DUF2142 domain-containing protein [Leifsonia poae]|uniref:DUF2142 domain-containing protein n=1 Tax=Leifsonia poae TaxID=110933 RepID=UPI001CC0BBDC|nr:DUF2142 domain-containing protein [Leifsonia poae]
MTRPDTAKPLRSRFRILLIGPVFALAALLCWSIASPVGSSPDDDYHLSSIWCGLGERPGLCEAVPGDPGARMVPAAAVKSICFARKPVGAGCQLHPGVSGGADANPSTLIYTMRGNFNDHAYPPVYYAFMSIFASPNFAVSVVVMRAVNILLFLAISTILFLLLPRPRKSALIWTWSITMVPLGIFLVASTNPSAWAIISAGTLFPAMLGYFESSGRRKIALGVFSALALAIGAGARADAAVYGIIAMGAALILHVARTRRFWRDAILPFALTLLAVGVYFSTGQSTIATSGFGHHELAPQMSTFDLFVTNLTNLPSLWAGVLGTWGLGWLDTAMPAGVWVTTIAIFGAFAFVGLASANGRKLLTLALVFFAMIALPSWFLLQSKTTVGYEVQPRYIFPLIIIFAAVALVSVPGRRIRFTRVQLVVVAVALTVANAFAMNANMRRYISGVGQTDWNLNHSVGWWWNIPVSPMVVWAAGSLAFGIAITILLLGTSRLTREVALADDAAGQPAIAPELSTR